MYRYLLTATAMLAVAAPAAAAPPSTTALNPVAAKPGAPVSAASTFAARVHNPAGPLSVSAAECNRRAAGVSFGGETMSLSGATDSRTLVSVPLSGANIASATTQQQITDVCKHN